MGVFSGVGSFVNDVLGGTSAAERSQKYALQSMKEQNIYNKEAAQNAHQWEVADLEKAGLNPILSAGGGGASMAGGSAISGQEHPGNLDLLGSITSAYKSVKDGKLADEQGQTETTKRILNIANSDLSKEQKQLMIKQEALTEAQTQSEKMLADLQFSQTQNEKIKYAINQVILADDKVTFEQNMMKLQKLAEEMEFEANPTYVALKKSFQLVGTATGAIGNIFTGSKNESTVTSQSIHYKGD